MSDGHLSDVSANLQAELLINRFMSYLQHYHNNKRQTRGIHHLQQLWYLFSLSQMSVFCKPILSKQDCLPAHTHPGVRFPWVTLLEVSHRIRLVNIETNPPLIGTFYTEQTQHKIINIWMAHPHSTVNYPGLTGAERSSDKAPHSFVCVKVKEQGAMRWAHFKSIPHFDSELIAPDFI